MATFDVSVAAVMMIERHGEVAGAVAHRLAADLLVRGDLAGSRVWRRVAHAAEAACRAAPEADPAPR
jgi:hypothetical protein